jgi:hypothetical protein
MLQVEIEALLSKIGFFLPFPYFFIFEEYYANK